MSIWTKRGRAHESGAPPPHFKIPPAPLPIGQHEGYGAELINAIENIYGKGMTKQEATRIIALAKRMTSKGVE